jgi:hypothetical protein
MQCNCFIRPTPTDFSCCLCKAESVTQLKLFPPPLETSKSKTFNQEETWTKLEADSYCSESDGKILESSKWKFEDCGRRCNKTYDSTGLLTVTYTVKNFRTPCCKQVTKTKDSTLYQKLRSAERIHMVCRGLNYSRRTYHSG